MSVDLEQFINDLTMDITPVTSVNTRQSTLFWLGAAFTFAAILALLTGPYRTDIGHDLLFSMQFLVESLVGLASVILLIYTAFEFAIPSPRSITRRLLLPLLGVSIWIGFYLVGLVHPALEPSMLGKREFCYYETFVFALPLMFAGLIWARMQWPIYPMSTGLLIGLAAGAVPALIMQFACMYDPQHILTDHILPGLSVGIVGALLGLVMLRTR